MSPRKRTGGRIVKPVDAATKYLLEIDPNAWLSFVGLTTTQTAILVESDLATVVAGR